MKNTKKNNKGFSLVELIVVVLIMAIIAVALAPQVMKWVNNSRIATDIQTADSVASAMQIAWATNKPTSTSVTFKTCDSDWPSTDTDYWNAVKPYFNNTYPTFKASNATDYVELTIMGGNVTRTYHGDFANTDLGTTN